MHPAHVIAIAIGLVSLALALGLSTAMLFLLWRRQNLEKGDIKSGEVQGLIMRHLAAVMSGNSDTIDFPPAEELKALAHLLSLVRGGERDKLLEYAENKGLLKPLLSQLRHPVAERRIDAIHEIERYLSQRSISSLRDTLHGDREPKVRIEAAMALARAGKLPPPQDLVKALRLENRKPNRIHIALFRSLAEKYPDEIGRYAKQSTSQHLKPLLVESIGWTNNLAMVQELEAYGKSPEPEVRASAIKAARHLGHPGAGRWIINMLDDPCQPVRVQAVQAVGEMRVKDALPRIKEMLEDPDWWVRTRAQSTIEILEPRRPSIVETHL